MLMALSRTANKFARANDGNIAVLFGLLLVPLLVAVGLAFDYGRALMVRERMGDAADAAALAVGSWPGMTQTQLRDKAKQFFDANYPASKLGTAAKFNIDFAGDDIVVKVTGAMPTTLMKVANVDYLNVGASTTVTKKERNIELALVLDTTGSMDSGGKLAAMKSAANQMVTTLFDDKSTSETLKIAVVPFSGAVNIGTDKLNSGWLDKKTSDTMSAIAKEDFTFTSGQSIVKLYDDLKNRDWAGCVRERAEPYELTDDAAGSGATLFAPYFAPDEPDDDNDGGATYANNYIADGTCGESKSKNKTPDKCQLYTGKYANASASSGKGPQYNCPPRPVTSLTNTKSTVTTAINALDADGNTVIPAGLLWGWRVLSPTSPFTEGKPYDDEKWVKAVVLLTDGENMVSGGSNGHNKSVYNAFGYARSGHLGNTSGSNAETTLNSKTATVCNAIKAKGIQVYTIGFQISSTTTQNMLKNCATKPDMYYNSPSNDQLASIFQDIAQGLGELRIAQ